MPSSNSTLNCDADMDRILSSDGGVSSLSLLSLNTFITVMLNFGGGTGVSSSVQFMVAPCGGIKKLMIG